MRIIIGGAGEVGVHLAKLLSKENHSIVVIDDNEEVLTNLSGNYDLMTIIGQPTSIDCLKDADCLHSDLFIGVTPDESRNLIACSLAKSLGVKKAVARIETLEYLEPSNRPYIERLGIDSLICPEKLAAQEIAEAVRRPWVRQYHEFDKGALVLVGVKLWKDAPLAGKRLMDTFSSHDTYRVAAIKRGHTTIIPSGHDILQADDMVYFIATKDELEKIRTICGKPTGNVKDVIIMGGSRIAVLTARLIAKEMNVKIIELNRDRAEWVKEKLQSNVMVIQGDGRDMDLLKDEGIDITEAYIALTDNAETNILACLAAKRFNLMRTVAEVEKLDYISIAEAADIGIVINKKLIAASHIFKMMLAADIANMKCLTFAEADVAEFIVGEKSKVTKKKVKELHLPENMSLGGLIRNGKGSVIYGDTQIMPGDSVVVFCLSSSLQSIERFFK